MGGVRCIDASVAIKLVLKGEAYRAAARKLFNDSIRAELPFVKYLPYYLRRGHQTRPKPPA